MKALPGPLLAGFLAVAGASAAGADDAAVRDLSIALDGVQVLASFRLADGLSPELLERIDSGLPTGFVFELVLLRDRKRWWDASLASTRIEIVAMFNAVTREYLVNTKHDGKLLDSKTVRDRAELERTMTRITAMPVFVLEQPSRRERYLVRARAELGTGNVLGFVPVMRATAWVDSNKVRVREP